MKIYLLYKDGNPTVDSTGKTLVTTTDANGFYLFDALMPGEYIVEILCDDTLIGTRKIIVVGPQQDLPPTSGTEIS